MNEGWIKLYRKLTDNPLWKCEKFTRGQAWVDLLLLANHEYGYFYLRNHKIEVQRGQVGYSQLKLAERWKWSRSKVKKFLNDMEKEQQVVQQQSKSTSIITIVNYELYQQKEQQVVQQQSNSKTTAEQQQDTNKNDKNVKKEEIKQFYELEKQKAEGKYKDKYLHFVKYLFGENEMNEEFIEVLKLEKQLAFKQFCNLMIKIRNINNEKGEQKIKLLDMITSMYNTPGYLKGKKSLYLTLNNWINRER